MTNAAVKYAPVSERVMAPTDPIDLYCERTDASLWSEPLNAVSNGAFIVAAFLVWRLSRRILPRRDRQVDVLVGLLAAIGIGSGLFHTLADVWSRWADILPIAATLLWFLWLFLIRVAHLSARGIAIGFGAFFAMTAVFGVLVPKRAVNGSNTYFSCAVALVAMGIFLGRRRSKNGGDFFRAASLFAVALICRSIDLAVCDALPTGTHFLWHLLNGAAFYVASRGLLHELSSAVIVPSIRDTPQQS